MAYHTLRHCNNFVKKLGINLAYEEGYIMAKARKIFNLNGASILYNLMTLLIKVYFQA